MADQGFDRRMQPQETKALDTAAALHEPVVLSCQKARLYLEVFSDVADALPHWETLEKAETCAVYQTRRFLLPWIARAAPASRVTPRIAVVFDDARRPIALLPFGMARRGPARAIVYLGGRDSNANMPLLGAPGAIPAADARAMLMLYAQKSGFQPDLFILTNQPQVWRGIANPFAYIHARPSPSAAYSAEMETDAHAFLRSHDSKSTRKKLNAKASKLEAIGKVIYTRATSPQEAQRCLAAFLEQKRLRLSEQGLGTEFSAPGVQAFLMDLATRSEGPEFAPALELHVLRAGSRIVASYGGLRHGNHWHGFLNSFDMEPEIARSSPADILLRRVVADISARGMTSFDLGIGEARYKDALCRDRVELWDTIVPVTAIGRVAASAETAKLAGKRVIKQTPWAYSIAKRVQAMLGRA